MNDAYKKQVQLLLSVLPEVAKEECFAMHGGTAINLFIRNMPRLSVDVDLTYVPIQDRETSLAGINAALISIKERIEGLRSTLQVQHKSQVCKLQVSEDGALIKIEVNMIGRGSLGNVRRVQLCDAAQEQFDVFCVMPLVSMAQLYGGKICAALDRQHPRDLFDVKFLLEDDGFSDEIKQGFIWALAGSNRPTHELLEPNLLDQRVAFENQFEGMSAEVFTYDDFEATRQELINSITASLDQIDKQFLMSLNRLQPDWSHYPYQDFPSVRWKLRNLETFRNDKPESYQQQLSELERVLAK
ncbi:MAG: nucleotidyl transferase AbiEii/AbiGii toxin family protein [Gammaproteobacteria bacterium]|nr:nucleotidyl transferase AbiEii/AbiGii toxin family protein [Gammaproteobacteria bacterium]